MIRRWMLLAAAGLVAAGCGAAAGPPVPTIAQFEIGVNGIEAPGGPFASTLVGVDEQTGDVLFTTDVPWTPFGVLVPTDVGFVVPYPGPPGDVGDPGELVPAGLAAVALDGSPSWQVDVPGAPQSIHSVGDDVLVVSHERAQGRDRLVPTGRSLIVRLDGRTGGQLWRATVDHLVGPVVVLEDEIVVSDPGKSYTGLDPADGAERWSLPTRARFDGGPAGKVTGDGSTAYALVVDAVQGPIVLAVADGAVSGWPVDAGEFLVAATGGVVVVSRDTEGDGVVTGFDAATGDELWTVSGAATGDFAGDAAVAVVERAAGAIHGVRITDGAILWSGIRADRVDHVAFAGDVAVAAQGDEFGRFSLTAYGGDRRRGPRWSLNVPGAASAGPTVAGGVVVAGGDVTAPGADRTLAGWLAAVDVGQGDLLWQIDPGREPAAVAVAGGVVYALTDGTP